MSAHVDLVADVSPEGARTPAARRHLATCADCRRRVTAVQRLAQLAGQMSPASVPREGRACLSTDEVLQAAKARERESPERIRAHLTACADCAMAVEEARAAMTPLAGVRRLVRIPLLPTHLRERIRALRAVLPLAAIPKDITRPSAAVPKHAAAKKRPKQKRAR